ncbi:MAG: VOC family protein [Actinomycetales bacterium]|nr:VOC family protein [Actinomycetales bacterium]
MAIATYPGLVIDCPDAEQLGRFYADILDWQVELREGWADIRAEYGQVISFQQVADFTAPSWPGQDGPQQMHLDLNVQDLDAAEAAVLALGARKHEHQPGETFRVFLDPAGHPFCLCAC